MGITSISGKFLASSPQRKVFSHPFRRGSNDRIAVGMIGVGDQGSQIIEEIAALRESHNVTVTALCDVWKYPLGQAAEKVATLFEHRPFETTRFGALLDNLDVDAVVIATPDFSHGDILKESIKSGKDVYIEKPMTMYLQESVEAVALTDFHESVVQVGTHWRSLGVFGAVYDFLRNKPLGHISRVSAAMSFNSPRWPRIRNLDHCTIEDVDWEAYFFNRPMQPFDAKLLCNWHLYRMFTLGLPGLWMSHFVDILNMVMGTTFPNSAVAMGGNYVWKDGRETQDVFHALLEYPEGFLFDWKMDLTNAADNYFNFHGQYGTLRLPACTYSGEGGQEGKFIEAGKMEPKEDQSHMGDWLDCIRSRQKPRADIRCGHMHSVATIMAAHSLDIGRRMHYDSELRQLKVGDGYPCSLPQK